MTNDIRRLDELIKAFLKGNSLKLSHNVEHFSIHNTFWSIFLLLHFSLFIQLNKYILLELGVLMQAAYP